MQEEILIKYLLGEATVEEIALVEGWLEEDRANQSYYLNLQKLWEQSKLLEEQPAHKYDTDAQWDRLKIKMGANSYDSGKDDATSNANNTLVNLGKKKGRIINISAWKWAAAIVIVLAGCWFAWKTLLTTANSNESRILTASASPVTDTLSDGSIITLNRYSSLQAPLRFNGRTREVTLQDGEAFFDVAHDARKPFMVHIDGVNVKVLGTSFNIKRNGNQTVIDVATGKIVVSFKDQHLIVHAQEKLSIDPSTTKLKSEKSEGLLYNYYVTKKFIANNTRLEDLVNTLNAAYNSNIVFGRPELKDMRITTVFTKEPIEVILNVISETFGIKVVYRKDSIELQ